jgi:heme-degrading monooxygenase HmoA
MARSTWQTSGSNKQRLAALNLGAVTLSLCLEKEKCMHARVVTFIVKSDKTETLTHIMRDDIIPALQQQTGFKGSRLLVEGATGKSMIVTLWESQAAIQATEDSGWFKEQLAKLTTVFATPPTREMYEVKVMV